MTIVAWGSAETLPTDIQTGQKICCASCPCEHTSVGKGAVSTVHINSLHPARWTLLWLLSRSKPDKGLHQVDVSSHCKALMATHTAPILSTQILSKKGIYTLLATGMAGQKGVASTQLGISELICHCQACCICAYQILLMTPSSLQRLSYLLLATSV